MEQRLREVAPLFQKYDSPISVAVRMAQFALESQAGQSVLFKKSNNGFGIKASAPWTGDKVLHNSMEVGGAQDSYFRKYPSLEASVKDHASFFTSTPYRANTAYLKAIQATDYKAEANALTGIYAGDPQYGKKLIDIIERYDLTQYDKEGNEKVAKLRTPIKKHTLVNSFGSNSNKPKFIVIHYVGAAGQSLANANYFYNVNRNASAHIFIDKNVTYEVVPEYKGAWHIGDGNSSKRGTHNGYVKPGMATNYNSLGIEMCLEADYSKPVTDWPVHPNVYEQTLLQTQAWMKKYNIPIENVIRHYDASQKLCPANWRFNNWAKWWEFKSDLSKLVKGGSIDVGGSTETSKYNPQGLQEVDLPEYREPIEPYIELREDRRRGVKGTNKRKGLLVGKIYCGHCGARISREVSGSKKYRYIWYTCYSRVSSAPPYMKRDEGCPSKRWKEDILNDIVIKKIKSLDYDEILATERTSNNHTENYQLEINKLERQKERLLNLYAMESIDDSMLDKKIKEIELNKESLSNKIEELKELPLPRKEIESLKYFDWDKEPLSHKLHMVDTLVDRINVFKDKVDIYFNF